jgi:hypothetical protein
MPAKKPKKKVVLSLEDEIINFVRAVEAVSPTHPLWKGEGVDVGRQQLTATDGQCRQVNKIGKKHGCHTCLTRVATDKNQPWIGDHQPPTSLSAKERAALGLAVAVYDGTVKLFPQCDVCSVTQAVTVKRIQAEILRGLQPNLNALGKRLLGIQKPKHTHSIYASSPKVSDAEGQSIQRLGIVHGCHSCGSRYPKDSYHADHCPPVCYTYSHVIRILQYAKDNIDELSDIKITQSFELRPQCPRCSHEQGGKMSKIARWSKTLAQRMNITVYRV